MTDGDPGPTEAFAAEWLRLRAPADQRARNATLAAELARAFAGHNHVRVLDLGAGTGNNLRATSPLLPGRQTWRLVDADPAALALVEPPEGISVETEVADLALGLEPLLNPMPDLVTASALIDLAGATWLEGLANCLAAHRLPFYCVLSYTGEEVWQPPHPLDDAVREALHADQGRDKGLGPALGPAAHEFLASKLEHLEHRILTGESDWNLTPAEDATLIAELARGTARAVATALGSEAATWGGARVNATSVRVSHSDLLALPPA